MCGTVESINDCFKKGTPIQRRLLCEREYTALNSVEGAPFLLSGFHRWMEM